MRPWEVLIVEVEGHSSGLLDEIPDGLEALGEARLVCLIRKGELRCHAPRADDAPLEGADADGLVEFVLHALDGARELGHQGRLRRVGEDRAQVRVLPCVCDLDTDGIAGACGIRQICHKAVGVFEGVVVHKRPRDARLRVSRSRGLHELDLANKRLDQLHVADACRPLKGVVVDQRDVGVRHKPVRQLANEHRPEARPCEVPKPIARDVE